MNFVDHSKLKGSHAFLSASKYHWINYDENKIVQSYLNHKAIEKGTELHEFAATCIKLGQKLPNQGTQGKKTLNRYVNDAIGFRMKPEQILYYSENCFGTADAICFRDKLLRIHDLKTGTTPAHMEQLFIYAAIFCLEYKYKPHEIEFELRIYQNDDIFICNPSCEEIQIIIDKIIKFDKIINKIKNEEG